MFTTKSSDKGPMRLNRQEVGRFLNLSNDACRISYTGPGTTFDIGCIRSDHPFRASKPIDYFEIQIETQQILQQGLISIGLSTSEFKTTKTPGWDAYSFGYSSNGKKYSKARENGKAFGPYFEGGDVIGCGIHYLQKEIFFTKNGKYLGVAFRNVSKKFYPTISLNIKGHLISVIFDDKKFKFDVNSLIQEEKKKFTNEIEETKIPHECMNELIEDYLYIKGYKKTLLKFQNSTKLSTNYDQDENLNFRFELKELIIHQGDILKCMNVLNEKYPDFFPKFINLKVKMYCQVFIEMIRKNEILEAIEFSRESMNEIEFQFLNENEIIWSNEDKILRNLIHDTFGTLVYDDPIKNTPVSYLFKLSNREDLYFTLNQSLLEFLNKSKISKMEELNQHIYQMKSKFREELIGIDEFISKLM
eukprot:gene7066-11229_t